MRNQSTYDLFISYADDDAEWVEGVLIPALGLSAERIITKESFRYGVDAVAEFERAVSESRYTLLILSPAFLADMWGMYSESIASYIRVKDERDRLLPLLLKPCQIPPRIVALKLSFDCTEKSDQDTHITRLRELFKQPETSLQPLPCPYPGMRPFTEADSQYFFGRKNTIKKLLERLQSYPFLSLIGPSGSGKSSLVFAGLIPALRRGQLFNTQKWKICVMRPGETPLSALYQTLGTDDLSHAEETVHHALSQQPGTQRLLLVIDQFEELFTLSKQDVILFQKHLQTLWQVSQCHVVLTVRADFYPDLMTSNLWEEIRLHRQEIIPLDREGLRDAILKPAEYVGVFVETALVERLVADAADEPGVLPLVQETLAVLWEGLEWRFLPLYAYEKLSLTADAKDISEEAHLTGLQVAIARHADSVLTELTESQRIIARRIFLRLVQFGEGRPDTRRQQPVKALRSADEKQEEFERILEHFATHRLLTRSGSEHDEEGKVDIAHDALIDGWPTLQTWVKERRKAEQTRRQLELKVIDWERLHREGGLLDEVELREAEEWLKSPDAVILGYSNTLSALMAASRKAIEHELAQAKETAHKLRKRLIFAVILAVIACVVAIGAYYQRNQAVINQIRAQEQASRAFFFTHDELPALLTGMKAGINAKRTRIPKDLHYQIITNLQGILYDIHEKNRLKGDFTPANCVFSPDGTLLAASVDGGIKLWSAVSGEELAFLDQPDQVPLQVVFSPDGALLASGSYQKTITLWQVNERKIVANLTGHTNMIGGLAFSPDGTLLASSSGQFDKSGEIKIWNVAEGKEILTLEGYTDFVPSLAFSPDGVLLASGTIDKMVEVRTTTDWRRLKVFPDGGNRVLFSPDGTMLATGNGQEMTLWDLADWRELKTFADTGILDAFSPDGTLLASRKNMQIGLWDVVEGRAKSTLHGHSGFIYSVAFSPDGTSLVSRSTDMTIRLWDITNGPDSIEPGSGLVWEIAFSPDGTLLAAGLENGHVTLWNVPGWTEFRTLQGHTSAVRRVAFSPDGSLLASGSHQTIKIWEVKTGRELTTLSGHPQFTSGIAFSPDGRLLVSGGRERSEIKLWEVASGKEVATLRPTASGDVFVFNGTFSPDGTLLASGMGDGTVKVWDVKSGREMYTLPGNSGSMALSVVFSPDGTLLASGHWARVVKLWDVAEGKEVMTLQGHSGDVFSVAFSPDGTLLGSGSIDGTINLWNVKNGRTIYTFQPRHRVRSIAFHPNGTLLAAGSGYHITCWNLDLDDLLVRGCDWLKDYLQNPNANVNGKDRVLCDDILKNHKD